MLQEKAIHCLSDRGHLRRVPLVFAVQRSITRGEQKDIPLAEGNVQRFRNSR